MTLSRLKITFCHKIIFIFIFSIPCFSQEVDSRVNVGWDTLKHAWRAPWIAHPTANSLEYGVFHFRKTFDLESVPDSLVIHVSGDNRYRLYVNGDYVTNGPARGDRLHWRYETLDIAPRLKTGENGLAALVVNFGIHKPVAQESYRTAFLLQADNPEYDSKISTGSGWCVLEDTAYSPLPVTEGQVHGFYAVAPGDSVNGAAYPWGWETVSYDDSRWQAARPVAFRGVGRGYMHGEGWYLTPRTIPLLEEKFEQIPKIRRSSGARLHDGFLTGEKPLVIPAQSTVSMLLDRTHLTMGYPRLTVSGGEGAEVRLSYGEALFDGEGKKGHRDQIEGKSVHGQTDVFRPGGGDTCTFEPLWLRTFRYIQLDVKTGAAPLTLQDFCNLFTAYPFEQQAVFESNDISLSKIWDVGWRTARLCAQETYYDCPYYEQLQYIGDTRIQALISLYVSGDDRLMRKAIQLFDDSRISDGITQSRYPTHVDQFIPPFSLWWVSMVHDYFMHREDAEFIQSKLPGVKSVLDYFRRHLEKNHMVSGIEWFPFVDWSDGWPWGVPPGVDIGHSTILSLQFVYALQRASELLDSFGEVDESLECRTCAEMIQKALRAECFVSNRGLFADTPEKDTFSQHANILAVLTDTAPEDRQQDIMHRVLQEKDLNQCTLYFRFYLFQALFKAGLGDLYIDQLKPWQDALDFGLTTFPETPAGNTSVVGSRSDCHAWSASPNYDFLATICGIRPGSPGFKTVIIRPNLGVLNWVRGSLPHPKGEIRLDIRRAGRDGLVGEVVLPGGVRGVLGWGDNQIAIQEGFQEIKMN